MEFRITQQTGSDYELWNNGKFTFVNTITEFQTY